METETQKDLAIKLIGVGDYYRSTFINKVPDKENKKWVSIKSLIEDIKLMKKQTGEEIITDELILRLEKELDKE